MEVPVPGVRSDLQLQVTAIATATPDPSRIHDLHHSFEQCRILNSLNKAREWTHRLYVRFCRATTRTPMLQNVLTKLLPFYQQFHTLLFSFYKALFSDFLKFSNNILLLRWVVFCFPILPLHLPAFSPQPHCLPLVPHVLLRSSLSRTAFPP